MGVVEVTQFRLADGVKDDAFLAHDRRLQTELFPNRPGFLRRTTARRDGDWVVVTLWSNEDDAASVRARHGVGPTGGRVRSPGRAPGACSAPASTRSIRAGDRETVAMELDELKATRYEVKAAVATITLHRPERLNASTGRMHTEYRALLARPPRTAGSG